MVHSIYKIMSYHIFTNPNTSTSIDQPSNFARKLYSIINFEIQRKVPIWVYFDLFSGKVRLIRRFLISRGEESRNEIFLAETNRCQRPLQAGQRVRVIVQSSGQLGSFLRVNDALRV